MKIYPTSRRYKVRTRRHGYSRTYSPWRENKLKEIKEQQRETKNLKLFLDLENKKKIIEGLDTNRSGLFKKKQKETEEERTLISKYYEEHSPRELMIVKRNRAQVPELDDVYKKYKDSVNMPYKEFKKWSENPCSKKASLDRKPIKRNLRLLKTPKEKWTKKDIQEANKTIAFNSRMSKVKKGKKVSKKCPLSKRDISLLNWARDPSKR